MKFRALWPCPRGVQIEVHGRPIACIVVYGHGNNESSRPRLFWSIREDEVGMIINSTPINVFLHR